MKSDLGVDDEPQEVSFANRFVHLAADLDVHWQPRIVGDSAGVHEPELTTRPVGLREMPIARRPGFFRDDGAVIADDAVEERRFPDIRTANERNDRSVHAATPARRGSPS